MWQIEKNDGEYQLKFRDELVIILVIPTYEAA